MNGPEKVLALAEGRRIDPVCDQFETDWQQNNRPRIEDYATRIEEPLRPALLSELLRMELEWRLRLGEQPSVEEYAGRFPDLACYLSDWKKSALLAVADRNNATTIDYGRTASPATEFPNGGETPAAASSPPITPFDPAAPAAGARLGEYELIEHLGTGGMGTVWKARHRRLGKLVALKLIRPGSQSSPAAVKRFLREMRAIGELDHPHVAEASDAGESEGVVYLVMKLIDGQDLARYVRQRGPLPIAEACDLARQAALGLDYLHQRGLVHRDVKPGNLMRTPDGTVKILDLGLARFRADEQAAPAEEQTHSGMALGTLDYMAPEQIADATQVDIRADLYALGATLFYLLTGRAPFGHVQGGFEKMKAVESTPAADVRTLRPETPDGLAELVARMLAKKPADRPQTPAEVAAALAGLVAGEEVGQPRLGTFTLGDRQGGRSRATAVPAVPDSSLYPTCDYTPHGGHGRGTLLSAILATLPRRLRKSPNALRRRRRMWPVWLGLGSAAALLAIVTLTVAPPLRSLTVALISRSPTSQPRRPWSEPAHPDAPRPPAAVGLPTVLRFDVSHAERKGETAEERGLLGINSFRTRQGDRVKVSVMLSRPAYGYLLAYSADGKEFLLDPPAETQAPGESEKLLYPPAGQRLEYELNDGVGLHVFLAVISSKPLPAYGQWQAGQGRAPWGKKAGRPGAVWRQVGGDLYAATAANPDVRGPGAVELGVEPVERLVAWWRKQPGVVEVGLTGFAVTKAE